MYTFTKLHDRRISSMSKNVLICQFVFLFTEVFVVFKVCFKSTSSIMEELKDAGNEIFNKSSMSVVELNNYVSMIYICCCGCSYIWPHCAGVVSNISQCQIAPNCAIARARSRKVSCATVYLIFISLLTLCLGS